MAIADPIIRLEGVSKAFGPEVVLDGVDLAVEAGKTTVVIGPSGSGKTVLLKHIIGLLRPDRGRVFFRDHEVTALPERRLGSLRQQMGFVFQGGALFDSMTIQENVCFPLVEHEIGTVDERAGRAREALAMVGVEAMRDKYPEELSGGQKKRVALARAIVMRPAVILYDEPTTGLDPIRADLIGELILRLQAALKTTAMIVTHDMTLTRKVADRLLMLYKGKFILDTTPQMLSQVRDELVSRFIEGRATDEELGGLAGQQEPPPPDSPGSEQ